MLLASAACTTTDREVENHFENAVAGVQEYYLSPEALKHTELAARQGNAGAAEKLSLYYGFVRRDLEKQIYWLKKAVDLGKEEERENLETLLEIRSERAKTAKQQRKVPAS